MINTADRLALEPLTSPRIERLLQHADFLQNLGRALGYPLNVVLPQQLEENVEKFTSVYDKYRLRGQILFSHKTNRSTALVRTLAGTNSDVDTASKNELQHALSVGFKGHRIECGGPKTPEYLYLALQSGATINIDSEWELETLANLCRRFGFERPNVMVRLSGFQSAGVKLLSRESRFGVHHDSAAEMLKILAECKDVLNFVGIAFHLDTVAISEKIIAFDRALELTDFARSLSLNPKAIDIGGGYKVNYLKSNDQWEEYLTQLRRAVLGEREAITWHNQGFGLRNEGGVVKGNLNLYSYYDPVTSSDYLDQLLCETSPTFHRPFSQLVSENLLNLNIEPGRALVEQCGVTISRVLDVRITDSGERLVRLEMNRGDVTIQDLELFMDPIVISKSNHPETLQPNEGVYFIGNLCLEADFIYRRKVFLPTAPNPGDLVVFVNTAGYLMDFSAHQAIQQPVARKVAAFESADGSWDWCLDEEFFPTKVSE